MSDDHPWKVWIQVALDGEKDRGDGGVVVVDNEQGVVAYLLVNELQPEGFREMMEDALQEEGKDFFFFCLKLPDGIKVLKRDRREVIAECALPTGEDGVLC